jgi:hypothetical protein
LGISTSGDAFPRSTTACTKANSASRVPLTGSTIDSGSTASAGSPNRRESQAAQAPRISGSPRVAG